MRRWTFPVLALPIVLASSSAAADVIPSCPPGETWTSHPRPAGVMWGHSGACEPDWAQLAVGALCCGGVAVTIGGLFLWSRRKSDAVSARGDAR